jgi:hypothetical protein
MKENEIYCIDCLEGLKKLEDNTIEAVITDIPYGIAFMGKDWDNTVPSLELFKELFRVLRKGAFFITTFTPRQSNQLALYQRLMEAGFNIEFSPIYWVYNSGFPKSSNYSKMADKTLFIDWLKSNDDLYTEYKTRKQLIKETKDNKELKKEFDDWVENIKKESGFSREVIGKRIDVDGRVRANENWAKEVKPGFNSSLVSNNLNTAPATPQAKALEGWYSYSPKPATEIIVLAQKPSGEKSLIDCALKSLEDDTYAVGGANFGATRIPYESDDTPQGGYGRMGIGIGKPAEHQPYIPKPRGSLNSTSEERKYGYKDCVPIGSSEGRFPANLVCGSGMNLSLEQLLKLQERIKNEKSE